LQPSDAELFALAGITALWRGVRSVSLIHDRAQRADAADPTIACR